MASTTLKTDMKDQQISYEVIRVEDENEVLGLLRKTFFKVKFLFAVFESIFRCLPFQFI